jgi:hypothetical protein
VESEPWADTVPSVDTQLAAATQSAESSVEELVSVESSVAATQSVESSVEELVSVSVLVESSAELHSHFRQFD